jgi:hypothetical protein
MAGPQQSGNVGCFVRESAAHLWLRNDFNSERLETAPIPTLSQQGAF